MLLNNHFIFDIIKPPFFFLQIMNNGLTYNGSSLMNISRKIETITTYNTELLTNNKELITNNKELLMKYKPYNGYEMGVNRSDITLKITIYNNTYKAQNYIWQSLFYKNGHYVTANDSTKKEIKEGGTVYGYIYELRNNVNDNLSATENVYLIEYTANNVETYHFIELYDINAFYNARVLNIVPNSDYVRLYNNGTSIQIGYFNGCIGYTTDNIPIFEVENDISNINNGIIFTLENHPDLKFMRK